jgi:hypothetical protein
MTSDEGMASDDGTTFEDGTGRNGTSRAFVELSFRWRDPIVIAASVGTDAKPTNNATINTYRRVGPDSPSER